MSVEDIPTTPKGRKEWLMVLYTIKKESPVILDLPINTRRIADQLNSLNLVIALPRGFGVHLQYTITPLGEQFLELQENDFALKIHFNHLRTINLLKALDKNPLPTEWSTLQESEREVLEVAQTMEWIRLHCHKDKTECLTMISITSQGQFALKRFNKRSRI